MFCQFVSVKALYGTALCDCGGALSTFVKHQNVLQEEVYLYSIDSKEQVF